MTSDATQPNRPPLLEVSGLEVSYPVGGGLFRPARPLRAVAGVSLQIRHGETLGLVGESGCGKSTLARAIARLEMPSDGAILFEGRNINGFLAAERRAFRRQVQMVFQDPFSSLNPSMTVAQALAEPLALHRLRAPGAATRHRVQELMEMVELPLAYLNRYPHEFSGGQRQRIGIARALACEPDLVILDEPVSALDVSIQAQVMRLLKRLQQDLGLAYLFIAHGLGAVRQISDRVAVMYLGRVVETGPRDGVFAAPGHPYTRALISSAPLPDPLAERKRQRIVLSGDLPSPLSPPPGCAFSGRCPMARPECSATAPNLAEVAGEHRVACLRHAAVAETLPLLSPV